MESSWAVSIFDCDVIIADRLDWTEEDSGDLTGWAYDGSDITSTFRVGGGSACVTLVAVPFVVGPVPVPFVVFVYF